MGRFWGSSQARAYVVSVLLLGGLFHACSLNPQPAPPAKEQSHDPAASAASDTSSSSSTSSSAATSTSTTSGGSPITEQPTSGTTSGAGVDSNGDGVIDSNDDPDAESPGATTGTTGMMPEGGFNGGAAGAAGAPAEAPPEPANGPR